MDPALLHDFLEVCGLLLGVFVLALIPILILASYRGDLPRD